MLSPPGRCRIKRWYASILQAATMATTWWSRFRPPSKTTRCTRKAASRYPFRRRNCFPYKTGRILTGCIPKCRRSGICIRRATRPWSLTWACWCSRPLARFFRRTTWPSCRRNCSRTRIKPTNGKPRFRMDRHPRVGEDAWKTRCRRNTTAVRHSRR